MANPKHARTYVTAQQATIHTLFVKLRSMSEVARLLGITQIRVREALVQVQRNRMRDRGLDPPPLREMMRGDVTTRFGVPRDENGGRPAKHLPSDYETSRNGEGGDGGTPAARSTWVPASPRAAVTRVVVTSAEGGRPVHRGFWSNLKAYAGRLGGDLVILRRGAGGFAGPDAAEVRTLVRAGRLDVGGLVDVAGDVQIAPQAGRPLDGLRARRECRWTLFPHGAIQMETLPRVRDGGLRVHMTTGSVTTPAAPSRDGRDELGAVVAEISSDGACHCRHLLATADGEGSFQDLDVLARGGAVRSGERVEALTFGDLHHAHLDARLAAATWGVGPGAGDAARAPLVDRLRPRAMIFHDVADFAARSHHDARNPHGRFALMVAGRECVRSELAEVATFLERTRRDWATSYVIQSNHDEALLRWLRETDFRLDPVNALFFLEASLALHRRLADGMDAHGFFEETLRTLSRDGLPGVRFMRPSESLPIAGVENAVHGHNSVDGKRGGMAALENLGIRLTIGHTHRPATRGGVYSAGVCQERLDYARGPLTAWAMGHVVTYAGGARQHLLFDGGRFHA